MQPQNDWHSMTVACHALSSYEAAGEMQQEGRQVRRGLTGCQG